MIVAIRAYEGIYQGLNGIESRVIAEVTDLNEAEDIAKEESMDLMHSYDFIIEQFEQEAKEVEELEYEEYEDYIEECLRDNALYEIWKIEDDLVNPESDLQEEFNSDLDSFVKKYHCERI